MAKIQRSVAESTGFGLNKQRTIAPSANDEQINAMMGNTFSSLSSNPNVNLGKRMAESVPLPQMSQEPEKMIVVPEKDNTNNPPEQTEKKKRGRKPSEKGKETLNVTIDKDIYAYLDQLVEETREPKSMVVNKILLQYMRENKDA